MTHDELLAICDNYSFKDSAEPVKALRAVVQLHSASPEGRYEKPICTECSFTETGHYVFYPCRNIQTIEKELM